MSSTFKPIGYCQPASGPELAPAVLFEILIKALSGRVQAAYVFGSYATGRQRPGSDLDLVLVVDTNRPFLERAWDFFDRNHTAVQRAPQSTALRNDLPSRQCLVLRPAGLFGRSARDLAADGHQSADCVNIDLLLGRDLIHLGDFAEKRGQLYFRELGTNGADTLPPLHRDLFHFEKRRINLTYRRDHLKGLEHRPSGGAADREGQG